MKLSNVGILLAIVEWQNGEFHPLTCLHHSNVKLVPVEINGEMHLVCPSFECGYSQSVPQIVIDTYRLKNSIDASLWHEDDRTSLFALLDKNKIFLKKERK